MSYCSKWLKPSVITVYIRCCWCHISSFPESKDNGESKRTHRSDPMNKLWEQSICYNGTKFFSRWNQNDAGFFFYNLLALYICIRQHNAGGSQRVLHRSNPQTSEMINISQHPPVLPPVQLHLFCCHHSFFCLVWLFFACICICALFMNCIQFLTLFEWLHNT